MHGRTGAAVTAERQAWRAAGDGEVGAWRSPMCRHQMVCGAKATNHEHGRRLNLQPEVTEGLPGLSEREQPILPLLLGRWGCQFLPQLQA